MPPEPPATVLSEAIERVVATLRASERHGGPPPLEHLAELRLHMLRARRPWQPRRRDRVELLVAVVRSQLAGEEAVAPFDGWTLTELVSDLGRMELALRRALPQGAAA